MAEQRIDRAGWVASALERYQRPLLRYAGHLLGASNEAPDVVQNTFLKLCREDPARLNGHLAPWLFRVCRNEAFDRKRRDRRLRPLEDARLPEQASPEPTPARLLEARDAFRGVLAALAALPGSQQEALRLKLQEGLSYRDIGTVMGVSVSHVGVLIHNGLKSLRARLQESGATSSEGRD